jgi:hypothetical protein
MFMVLMLLVKIGSGYRQVLVTFSEGCTPEGKRCCGTYINNSYRKDGLDRGMWSHEKYLC